MGDLSEKLRDGTQSRGYSKGKGRAKSFEFHPWGNEKKLKGFLTGKGLNLWLKNVNLEDEGATFSEKSQPVFNPQPRLHICSLMGSCCLGSVLRRLLSLSPSSAGKGVLQSINDAWVLSPCDRVLLLVSDVCHRQLNRLWLSVCYMFAVQG